MAMSSLAEVGFLKFEKILLRGFTRIPADQFKNIKAHPRKMKF